MGAFNFNLSDNQQRVLLAYMFSSTSPPDAETVGRMTGLTSRAVKHAESGLRHRGVLSSKGELRKAWADFAERTRDIMDVANRSAEVERE